MVLTLALYISVTICLAGCLYRIGRWFTVRIGPEARLTAMPGRIAAALREAGGTLLSRRIISVGRIFITEVLLQLHILKQSFWRWCMHLSLFYGVAALVLVHALDETVTRHLFASYEPTLNPFLFLRNLFALWVLIGVAIAIYRRRRHGSPNLPTGRGDRAAIGLVAGILVSGILLEAAMVISEPIFNEMVADYMGADDPQLVRPLKVYWAEEYGVVFSPPVVDSGQALLREGAEIHEGYCAGCHDRPQTAFLSYAVAKGLKPLAAALNRIRIDTGLYYLHYLAALALLAWLPFSKFFHLIATPLSLLSRASVRPTSPESLSNRRALALDACTHCGVCTLNCRVAPVYRILPTPSILPSEKLAAFKRKARKKRVSSEFLISLSEGSFICTQCRRCTEVCPSGIDLQDLWQATRSDLKAEGFPEPHVWIRRKTAGQWADSLGRPPRSGATAAGTSGGSLGLTDRPETFSACVQCTTCTTVCPVVASVPDPAAELDLTPQQIMNLLRLEMKPTALGARMVWKCVTCYMCQEHCPQGVRVADVLYELRNIACRDFNPGEVCVLADDDEAPV